MQIVLYLFRLVVFCGHSRQWQNIQPTTSIKAATSPSLWRTHRPHCEQVSPEILSNRQNNPYENSPRCALWIIQSNRGQGFLKESDNMLNVIFSMPYAPQTNLPQTCDAGRWDGILRQVTPELPPCLDTPRGKRENMSFGWTDLSSTRHR